jgi:hypothetical protein
MMVVLLILYPYRSGYQHNSPNALTLAKPTAYHRPKTVLLVLFKGDP